MTNASTSTFTLVFSGTPNDPKAKGAITAPAQPHPSEQVLNKEVTMLKAPTFLPTAMRDRNLGRLKNVKTFWRMLSSVTY